MKKLLVFTDLDGSLLNHDDYSWQAAVPALQALKRNAYPLILNSSKTATEIHELNRLLENNHPFVCENGAVAIIPEKYFTQMEASGSYENFDTQHFGKSYEQVVQILGELRNKYRFEFRGFHDMTVDDVMEETGLRRPQASAAKQRMASEPLQWLDSPEQLEKFRALLKIKGLILTAGGRFFHVMSNVNKGNGVSWLLEQYQRAQPRVDWVTVGLGDSQNDVPMMETVEYPVLISNPASKQPDVSHLKHVHRTKLPGAAGWNEAILHLLDTVK